jgi:hypothetical protein
MIDGPPLISFAVIQNREVPLRISHRTKSMPKVAASCRSTSLVPFWIALSFWAGLSSLLILGLWLRANTYAVPPDNFTLRVLNAAELAKLSPDQQKLWSRIPESDRYAEVSLKNPFVFRLVFPYAAPGIVFAGVALISSLWNPLRPRRDAPAAVTPGLAQAEYVGG